MFWHCIFGSELQYFLNIFFSVFIKIKMNAAWNPLIMCFISGWRLILALMRLLIRFKVFLALVMRFLIICWCTLCELCILSRTDCKHIFYLSSQSLHSQLVEHESVCLVFDGKSWPSPFPEWFLGLCVSERLCSFLF